MNKREINKIHKQYKGKKFIIGINHPHAGKLVRCIEFSEIEGCAEPGMLVKSFVKHSNRFFRVFDLNNLIVINQKTNKPDETQNN